MNLIRLSVENFMGLVGEHHVPLDNRGLVHIAGRNLDDPANNSNGSGKSTILEALTWGLFGEGIPRPQGNGERGCQADEVLNDRLGRQCRVTVQLQDEGTTYQVDRWRKWKPHGGQQGNGVRFIAAGEQVQALDEKETDRLITERLGITHEIWCRGVVFGQEASFNFCDATALQRQDILTTVLGLQQVDGWQERCRDDKRALTTRLADVGGQVEVLNTMLARARTEDPAPLVNSWELGRTARLQALVDKRATSEARGRQLAGELRALPPPPELPAPASGPSRELDQSLQEARRVHQVVSAELVRAQGQVGASQLALEKMRRFNQQAVCPTCQQAITPAHRVACEAAAAAQGVEAQRQVDGVLPREREAHARMEQLDRAVREAQDQVRTSQLARQPAEQAREHAIRNRARLEGEIQAERRSWSGLDDQLVRAQQEPNPHLAQVEQHRQRVERMGAELATGQTEQGRLARDLDVCQWWDRELPRFKTWMFDSVVDVLAGEANRWLKIMSGGVIWIQITTQREVGKRLKDELDVEIYRWNPDGSITSRPYRLWSGGEKRRVALAVDLGLSRLMASRASRPYRFIALDEIDRHLDDRGKEGLRQVLDQLRAERDTCLVITHDPEFRASFDNEMVVVKERGQTRLEIRHGDQRAAQGTETTQAEGGGTGAAPTQEGAGQPPDRKLRKAGKAKRGVVQDGRDVRPKGPVRDEDPR